MYKHLDNVLFNLYQCKFAQKFYLSVYPPHHPFRKENHLYAIIVMHNY